MREGLVEDSLEEAFYKEGDSIPLKWEGGW